MSIWEKIGIVKNKTPDQDIATAKPIDKVKILAKINKNEDLQKVYNSFSGSKDLEGQDMQEKFIKWVDEHPGLEPGFNKEKREFTIKIYRN
ncbi:MAG: hypothetical protein WC662_01715 [Candidatus Paceibacterota bacterium]|jgi:hypothetical protein